MAQVRRELKLIPCPQEVLDDGNTYSFKNISIVADKNATSEDHFTSDELARNLRADFNIDAKISNTQSNGSIILTRKGADKRLGKEGYQLLVSDGRIQIIASDAAGIFYGTQTLLQLIEKESNGFKIPGVKIKDWPVIKARAVHYDTKHHQDKKEYVEGFIRDLAHYKVNQLVWEWEDKLAYTSHPEIGAPGAFTIAEMQHFTQYAKRYHIELIPLVQGLGHVSFILKWPQFGSLREIPSSNWEFCPLKEDSYKLLFDLWDEAIKATPGSSYIHIGSDETYELGSCPQCQAKSQEIGKSGVYLLFTNKAAEHFKKSGRGVMVWEPPQGWEMSKSPSINIKPAKSLVLTESYEYETGDFKYAKRSKELGYKVFAYDPNPGIEHLFLPYFFKEDDDGRTISGCLEDSHNFYTATSKSNAYDGIISTSWDDSGLHNQAWMLRFATAASFSWNASKPSVSEFPHLFFEDYYGPTSLNMDQLFYYLNEGAYYYMSTFERKVWHWGDVGKTHLPDTPRGEAIEFDPFWNSRYNAMISKSLDMQTKMKQAIVIIDENLKKNVRHSYDLEVFRTMARLIQHTAETYVDFSNVEKLLAKANRLHYEDRQEAYQQLETVIALLQTNLETRRQVFNELVTCWEKSRLTKGLSTADKKYFFQQDRARHFANRQPDMRYLIYDEEKLGVEDYLEKMKSYSAYYKQTYLQQK
jgi:hypothetical protein